MKHIIIILLLAAGSFYLAGCSKQDEFLDEKYNLSDVIPQTLEEFQGLLDYDYKMNVQYSAIGQVASDNYYIPDEFISQMLPVERNGYTWNKDIFEGAGSLDWASPYVTVGVANVVLEGLEKFEASAAGTSNFNQVKGSALFYRAFAFYNLAQAFCKPYTATAGTDLGIVLRTQTDIHAKVTRATVKETYEKITADLLAAESLLPDLPLKTTRPSKAAVYGLLAKMYLNVADYPKAEEYATKALDIQSVLLDFNTVPVDILPFGAYYNTHPEFVFYALNVNPELFSTFGISYVDSALYDSYEDNDLRKVLFYSENPNPPTGMYFQGSYGVGLMFGGIATNELYLVKAEAQIRQNKVSEGMVTLNALLVNRYASPFVDKIAADQAEALTLVLNERRKELPFTSQLRWEDLRRLNLDPATAITIQRVVNGTTVTLPPNDPRYVLPIPDNEIRLNNLEQNIR